MAGKLYTPVRLPGIPSLVLRAASVLGLIGLAVLVLYVDRDNLVDASTPGEHPGFLDCIYFAMVTITTVGYGDIYPEAIHARLIDAFLLAPIRLIVLFTFLGTAYQLVIKRFQEEYRMKRAVTKLNEHVIVCGYGAAGRAAVQELLLLETPADQIVVLDESEEALSEAAESGVVAVSGDATRESVLASVAVDRAANVIVCPGRDDTAVLIALTARDLSPKAKIIATCREEENVKLLQRSGADTIVSPAFAGGNLMAAATRRAHIVETMQEVLSVGGALRLDERPVAAGEVGKRPNELEGVAVLRVYRGNRHYDVARLPHLAEGDTIVFVAAGAAGAAPAS
ncbi:MAG: potassium channel family protein [Candidatus Hydrogenedentes bacterium]|nr:potassium channel family protein [Candidatus Hydrogenedentota bacterium]